MALSAEERLKRIRESQKRWQQAHPEKNRIYRERWILKKAAQLQAQQESAGEVDRHETSPA